MKLRYTYWLDMGWYVGHLDKYPELRTQGKTLEDLQLRLRTMYGSMQKAHITMASINRRHGHLDIDVA